MAYGLLLSLCFPIGLRSVGLHYYVVRSNRLKSQCLCYCWCVGGGVVFLFFITGGTFFDNTALSDFI